MSRTVATFLLDIAAWIAPSHRREWIAGLRAEAALAEHPTGWAWGALTTALGQRLADTVVSGLALRLVLGGFVMSVAMWFAIFIVLRIPELQAAAARGHQHFAPMFLMVAAIIAALLSGGAAIAFSAGRPWFNRYGRLAFAAGCLSFGLPLAGALAQKNPHGYTITAYGHQQDILSTIAGVLLVVAAPALLLRWRRLFLVLATGAVGIEIAQYVLSLPYLPLLQNATPAVAFANACLPGLLILAASGLLIDRKRPVVA